MGRLRYKPWADQYLKDSSFVVNNPETKKGKWSNNVFDNDHDIHLEIGHGKGDFINNLATNFTNYNYIGLEKFSSVQVVAVKKAETSNLANIKFVCADALNLPDFFNKEEVSKIYINFPDPWPKDRHRKRRLVSQNFLDVYNKILKKDGEINFKTDQHFLYEFAKKEIGLSNKFKIVEDSNNLHKNKKIGFLTEYEQKFISSGKQIYFLRIKVL